MKFLFKLFISLAMGAVCLWLAVRNIDLQVTADAVRALSLRAIAVYAATMVGTHLFRAWRWQYLLRPIGVSLPFGRLLAISSVGFMTILALPVRLGEFIRPYYVVRSGQSRMSAVLGTVAVERIVDGLVISMLFFGCYLVSEPGSYGPELRFGAWLSLLGFVGLTLFLAFALRWPEQTIRLALALSLLSRLRPKLAERIADKLRALIQGFRVLHQPRDLVPFLVQTVLYWGCNGMGMWLLAQEMNLHIPLIAAYAAMAVTGVLISLPNSPGLVGQFHLGVGAGLHPYLADPSRAVAYAFALHGIQVVWYVGLGLLALFFVGDRGKSLRDVVLESKAAAEGGGGAQ